MMATWTQMKVKELVQIEWADALKRFVRCKTLYGEMTESVDALKTKLESSYLLPAIRSIFQDMLNFAENKDDVSLRLPPSSSSQ